MPAYQPSDLPPEDADFGPSHDEITAELLTLSWQFFHTSPTAWEELRRFLASHDHHPVAGLEAFLDGLQFSANHLHRRSRGHST
ncbi:hypothetical protein GCM10010174_66760 [Kutzneria viridogrisea]|uniref:Uncharacterized protein n=2 Tax=Kutzneria TaxID=43356 RepID=W5WDI3_9PSEU|nr:hypothetical protein [Kutzneria albida]AHH98825.1 hypothetical protein KALB_5463 [Kutzneria albida DSM 43870]MBA8923654.1 hypothetical protein [Kutzneria viridogrisea]